MSLRAIFLTSLLVLFMGTAFAQRAAFQGFKIPGAVASPTPDPTGIWDGCLAYYRLDEASGTRVDATGHGYNLGPSSNTVTSTTGVIGTAAVFPGHVPLTNSSSVFSSAKTISGWFKLTQAPTSYQRLINAGIQCYSSGYLVWDVTHYNTIIPTVGQWHFVCVVLNGSTVTMWVNAQSWTVQTGASKISDPSFELSDPTFSQAGAVIDEVGVWNRALSTSEISALYNAGSGLTYP